MIRIESTVGRYWPAYQLTVAVTRDEKGERIGPSNEFATLSTEQRHALEPYVKGGLMTFEENDEPAVPAPRLLRPTLEQYVGAGFKAANYERHMAALDGMFSDTPPAVDDATKADAEAKANAEAAAKAKGDAEAEAAKARGNGNGNKPKG